MKIKKLAQILIVSCGILALGACSTTKHRGAHGDSNLPMNDMANANGAQATGLGDDATYGDGSGAKGRLAKRTYYFEYDKYVVQPDDKAAILANADWIAAHPNSKVILEGHTDPRGSREYNIALGESRAKSVLDILQSRGVNPNQIRIVSYGAERPAATGRTDQDFQLDRRAILVAQK